MQHGARLDEEVGAIKRLQTYHSNTTCPAVAGQACGAGEAYTVFIFSPILYFYQIQTIEPDGRAGCEQEGAEHEAQVCARSENHLRKKYMEVDLLNVSLLNRNQRAEEKSRTCHASILARALQQAQASMDGGGIS